LLARDIWKHALKNTSVWTDLGRIS